MNVFLVLVFVVVLLFGFVVIFGAPYVPTLGKQTKGALDLLALKPGQTLLELGSGDGKVLKEAAKRGIRSIGYEINPILVIYSWLTTLRYRGLVRVHWANFWRVKLPLTDGIYVFLLDRYMNKLDKKITQEITKDVKLVSFGFAIPGKKPIKSRSGLFLYKYSKR